MSFNKLTPAETERLAILSEECAEVIQVVGKIMRHGYESKHPHEVNPPTNREDLQLEIGDIGNIVNFMMEKGDVSLAKIEERIAYKEKQFKQYLHHQEENNVEDN